MTVKITDDNPEDEFGFNVEFATPRQEALAEGFNKHGVRVNDDGSVDVRFRAMEPGVRRGIEVTEEFLRRVASHDYSRLPAQLDHSQSQRANVGYIEPNNIQFSDGALYLQPHIPDTGSTVRGDMLSDFKHDPPQIQDGSVSFDPRSIEVEPPETRNDEPTFVDARLREFSFTPFPAGYDNGGLTPAFSSAIERACIDPSDSTDPQSRLVRKPHILIRN